MGISHAHGTKIFVFLFIQLNLIFSLWKSLHQGENISKNTNNVKRSLPLVKILLFLKNMKSLMTLLI